jgi:ribonuclease-3
MAASSNSLTDDARKPGDRPQAPQAEGGLGALEARLGHRFKDRSRLVEALTHASAGDLPGAAPINERLEFLGDRVLGLLTAEALIERFPDAREGDLAPRFNALVRKERCAAVAAELGLAAHVRVADSEARPGRGLAPAILADACEAVIAAIYLDGGLEAARVFFAANWAGAIGEVEHLPRDAKSALQEWSQDRALGLPAYESLGRTGPDHAPEFTIRVSVQSHEPAEGRGPSKRAAEQAAAAAFLLRENIWNEDDARRASSHAA